MLQAHEIIDNGEEEYYYEEADEFEGKEDGEGN